MLSEASFFQRLVLGQAIVLIMGVPALADFPKVRFDMGLTVECREVPNTASKDKSTKIQ
jgi:hypothetical protein